jgi:tetratricopeptide (TPR) repeat protein
MSHIDRQKLKHDPVAESLVHLIGRLKQHTTRLVLVGGIILIALVAAIWWYQQKEDLPYKASMALLQVQSLQDLENIPREYPKSFAAPAALTQLGYAAFQQTNYARALAYYSRIADEYPDYLLTPSVRLAMAKCHLALSQFAEAERILRNDVLYDIDHYAAFQGQLVLVKVLAMQKRYDEAWEEMKKWDQMARMFYMTSLGDGLREQLLRETGISTTLVVQAENQPVLQ